MSDAADWFTSAAILSVARAKNDPGDLIGVVRASDERPMGSILAQGDFCCPLNEGAAALREGDVRRLISLLRRTLPRAKRKKPRKAQGWDAALWKRPRKKHKKRLGTYSFGPSCLVLITRGERKGQRCGRRGIDQTRRCTRHRSWDIPKQVRRRTR